MDAALMRCLLGNAGPRSKTGRMSQSEVRLGRLHRIFAAPRGTARTARRCICGYREAERFFGISKGRVERGAPAGAIIITIGSEIAEATAREVVGPRYSHDK